MKAGFHKRALSRLHGEKGMTLIEVLAGMMIISMIVSILYSFMLMGVTMYKRITVETQLRNQANYIFSSVIDNLRDGVYAEPVYHADGTLNEHEVLVVKRSDDPNEYVHEVRLKFTSSAFEVIEPLSGKVHEYPLANTRFTMDGNFTDSSKHDLVWLKITFTGNAAEQTIAAEQSNLQIDRKIPLFRLE